MGIASSDLLRRSDSVAFERRKPRKKQHAIIRWVTRKKKNRMLNMPGILFLFLRVSTTSKYPLKYSSAWTFPYSRLGWVAQRLAFALNMLFGLFFLFLFVTPRDASDGPITGQAPRGLDRRAPIPVPIRGMLGPSVGRLGWTVCTTMGLPCGPPPG